MSVGMALGMPANEPGGGLRGEGVHEDGNLELVGTPTDRAEFLGEDGSGREYWLFGGRVYAEGDGRTFPVCPLAGWGRLRKLHTTRGFARGRALRRAQAA